MPLYDRKCETCDELFEVQCRISEKDNEHECPYCGSKSGSWMVSAAAVTMRGDRLMTAKRDRGFGEVISKIQERNKRTPIAER